MTAGEKPTLRTCVPSSVVLGVTAGVMKSTWANLRLKSDIHVRDLAGYDILVDDPTEDERGAGVEEGDSDEKVAVPYRGERKPDWGS